MRLTRPLRAVATKLHTFMKKLSPCLALPLLAVLLLSSGCSSATSEPDEPTRMGTTLLAAPYVTTVESAEPLKVVEVGKPYLIRFHPYSVPQYADFLPGSVASVRYVVEAPYGGAGVVGIATEEPFNVEFTPTRQMVGQCTVVADVELLPTNVNQWIAKDDVITVVEAGTEQP